MGDANRGETDPVAARLDLVEKRLKRLEAFAVQGIWTAIDKSYDGTRDAARVRCIVCAHEASVDALEAFTDRCTFGGGVLKRFKCSRCDCIFGPMKYLELSDELVALDYQLLYSTYSEGDSTASELRTFASLEPRRDGLYLDWGSGGAWSRTVRSLRDQGWDVWGYEPGIEQTGNFVVKTRAEVSARFDGIFSNNVIEHFRRPVEQFVDFASILKPGGTMAHSSPCYEYRYSFSRFHTLFLLGRSPYVLAERTGFKVRKTERDGEYINFVFERV